MSSQMRLPRLLQRRDHVLLGGGSRRRLEQDAMCGDAAEAVEQFRKRVFVEFGDCHK